MKATIKTEIWDNQEKIKSYAINLTITSFILVFFAGLTLIAVEINKNVFGSGLIAVSIIIYTIPLISIYKYKKNKKDGIQKNFENIKGNN